MQTTFRLAPKPAAPNVGEVDTRMPLVAVCLGFFMITLDATVVNTALPAIGRDLGADVTGLQWVNAGYTLVFACLLLSAGALGDRLGARRVFLLGLTVFTLASVACGLSPSLGVLIAARVVQGAGAALVLPTSLALLNASYPDRTRRAHAIGVWAGLGGVAAGLGPVLGGVLTTGIGWPAIFFVNAPIGAVAALLTVKYVRNPLPRKQDVLNARGQVLSVVAIAALAYGLIEAGPHGWTAPDVLAAFALAAGAVTAFALVDRRSRALFTGAAFVGAAINTGFYGELFLLALYFQDVRHLTPLVAGLAMAPQPGIAAVASWLGGRHIARFGARRVMLVGLPIGALGLFTMVLIGGGTPYWKLILPLLAIGFGTAYTMPAATVTAVEAVPAHQAGAASGALNASRQLGSTLGVAVFGTLTASAGFLPGYRLSALVGGAVFAVAMVRRKPCPG